MAQFFQTQAEILIYTHFKTLKMDIRNNFVCNVQTDYKVLLLQLSGGLASLPK
jgi:hypothetical protein